MSFFFTYFTAESIKIRRTPQLRYVILFFTISSIVWAVVWGKGMQIDGDAIQQAGVSAKYIFFMVENYFFLPVLLFIPYYCLKIEHDNHTLNNTYIIPQHNISWILSKLVSIVLLYEITVLVTLYISIYILQYFLFLNFGSSFNATWFTETSLSYLKFYTILYLPNLLLMTVISLMVKKFSNIIVLSGCIHLFAIQRFGANINPFHTLFYGFSIQSLLEDANTHTFYTREDINYLYVVALLSSVVLTILIVMLFKKIRHFQQSHLQKS